MVAVLCVALVVASMLVNGLGGISRSSFSRISFTLRSVPVGDVTRLNGVFGNAGIMEALQ